MIKTMKKLMRIARKSDEDATTKRNPLRAMHLKKVKTLKTGGLHFLFYRSRGVQLPRGIQCAGAVRISADHARQHVDFAVLIQPEDIRVGGIF